MVYNIPLTDSDEELIEVEAPLPVRRVSCLAQRGQNISSAHRMVPEETAIAFTYNGSTHAVMMATPQDLEDFAIGFATTEGPIESVDEVSDLEIVVTELGVELRTWLPDLRAKAYSERRRSMAGPTGCGLCGIESLEQAMRPIPSIVSEIQFEARAIVDAMDSLSAGQKLQKETRAIHAAGFWTPAEGLIALREDVGRHNALDKLIGAMVKSRLDATLGLIVMTSRVSVELIQKSARIGAPVLAAISAPTAAAIRLAEASGMTLIAVARGSDFEIFTHSQRISNPAVPHVA
jgi:FdhD protein